ncbi:MAG TPA: DUF4197 domain-containing protein, partial [Ferruginibacter sp.]|nr:DUF4197 domain-containing protein [Ferruginibacter sp.]HRB56163.1 DUF4197 domain-containing protein [Ferruginibacter sp.]
GSSLSNDDVIKGLKEALTIGTENSAKLLHNTDGFLGNAAIKILMPEEGKKAEQVLHKMGMGKLANKVILSLNRAAEDAAGGITTIFWDAIKGMTLTDGLTILKGNDDAATQFLKKATSAQLTEKMKPVINQSLSKVNATKYWDEFSKAANTFKKAPQNTNLADYVTEKALDGIFYTIAQEEKKIRKDPAAQVSDLLKKVFGGKQ